MWRFFCVVFLIPILVTAQNQEVPFRNKDSYTLELGMEYKKIPPPSSVEIVPGQSTAKTDYGHDFFLKLILNILELNEGENRIKIVDNTGVLVLSRKLKKPELFEIDLGRATEIKRGNQSNKYKIEFIKKDKTVMSQILIEFNEHHEFLVNNIVFGKI